MLWQEFEQRTLLSQRNWEQLLSKNFQHLPYNTYCWNFLGNIIIKCMVQLDWEQFTHDENVCYQTAHSLPSCPLQQNVLIKIYETLILFCISISVNFIFHPKGREMFKILVVCRLLGRKRHDLPGGHRTLQQSGASKVILYPKYECSN